MARFLAARRTGIAALQSMMEAAAQPSATVAAAQPLLTCRAFGGTPVRLSEAAAALQPVTPSPPPFVDVEEPRSDLTPREVVERLDRNIVGQAAAKKAVANALRNRWRRHKLGSPMKEEIVPKNILMIGPTGCGKTEIARRLAKLMDAPFVKVEATKFTEVGFHGRDVDQIIRDLVENAMTITRARLRRQALADIALAVEDKLISALTGAHSQATTKDSFRRLYREGQLEDHKVTIDVPIQPMGGAHMLGDHNNQARDFVVHIGQLFGKAAGKTEKKEMKVSEARPIVEEAESSKVISDDMVQREAIQAAEQGGIVFIDEIDKIVTSSEHGHHGADASSEGVQRDLLPIIEGSVVSTKFGNVATDHMLFICSGAFHTCKPSDMLAEMQGRLPIRVELQGLKQADFYRILTEPENNMIRQQQALLSTEDIDLEFTADAVMEVSRLAEEINTNLDNIGARRLHTVLERILEDISFDAPEKAHEAKQQGHEGRYKFTVDQDYVSERLSELVKRQDLSKFVL